MARKKHPNEKQSEKIVTYMTPTQKKVAEKKAKKEGHDSLSSWALSHLGKYLV